MPRKRKAKRRKLERNQFNDAQICSSSIKLRTRAHEDTLVAAKIKYLMMESKLCILVENYSRAEENAGKALNKGKQYKFELEIGPAQDQIDLICVTSASEAKLQVKNIASRYACNSTTTMDSDQKASRSELL